MKQDLLSSLRAAAVALLAFTVLTGIVYPGLVLGIGQALFPHQANGSLIDDHGKVVGSELVGQSFTAPGYFWSRRSHLSAVSGFEYNATNSVGANYGFSDGKGKANPALVDPTKERIAKLRDVDPNNRAPVPADLVTASSSGLDPHITPAAAYYQLARVARARGMPEPELRSVVDAHVEPRSFGILGEPRINVVRLNRALDARKPLTR